MRCRVAVPWKDLDCPIGDWGLGVDQLIEVRGSIWKITKKELT